MGQRSRVRWAAKWGGIAACAAIAVAYVSGVWWAAGWQTKGYCVRVWAGSLDVLWWDPNATGYASIPAVGWFAHRHAKPFVWGFDGDLLDGYGSRQTPLWALMVAAAGASAAVWLWAGRGRPGCCRVCDYDLRGLREGAVCPECGTALGSPGLVKG